MCICSKTDGRVCVTDVSDRSGLNWDKTSRLMWFNRLYDNPMSRLSNRWSQVPPMLRFLAVFLIALLALAILFPWLSARYHQQMLMFMSATAWLVGKTLILLGEDIVISGRFLSGTGFSIQVIEECTGAYEILIFWAAVIAYPSRWRGKLIGLTGGAVALIALNVIRMVFLFMIGQYRNDWFDFMHTYFWQATLILMITTVWIVWIKLVASRMRPAGV
ncbi:MAG: exosortase H [candidate division Zixibacteria bacterium]|nr:exosortase H [candidate division Zixibacteria bacterium]